MGREEKMVVLYNTGDDFIIPKTEDEVEFFLKRMALIDFMSSPETKKNIIGLKKFAESVNVPIAMVHRWLRQDQVQRLIAKRAREMALGGYGIAVTYTELIKMALKPGLDPKVKAKVLVDLAKLDLRRAELALRYMKKKDLGSDNGPVPVEAVIEEVEADRMLNE